MSVMRLNEWEIELVLSLVEEKIKTDLVDGIHQDRDAVVRAGKLVEFKNKLLLNRYRKG